MIPMVDLKEQYHSLKAEIDAALQEVLENTHFILGPNVRQFEEEAAAYLGAAHAVSCASGTDALHLALRAAGIGPGDEVILPAFTFIATAEAVSYTGATPVFVDIDPRTFNMDPQRVADAVTARTRALLPVHLFGQPADLPALQAIARRHDLVIIEDCAQSFGARRDGIMTGTAGLAGCHSFFPSKNLGAYGDGGMITTGSETMAERLRQLRNHGSTRRYHHDFVGYNSRLDEIQAAILRIKLRRIDDYNEGRRRAAHQYTELLHDVVETPYEDPAGTHVFHQYTILTDRREAIQEALAEAGIASAVYYPIPLHRQAVYREACRDVHLPVTESVCERCLSLPIYPELPPDTVEHIAQVVRRAAGC